MKSNNIDSTHHLGVVDNGSTRELWLDLIRSKIEIRSIRDRIFFEMSLIAPAIKPQQLINLNVSDINVKHRLVRINDDNKAMVFYKINEKSNALLEQKLESISEGDTPLLMNEFGERLSLYQFWLIKRQIWIDITLLVYEI